MCGQRKPGRPRRLYVPVAGSGSYVREIGCVRGGRCHHDRHTFEADPGPRLQIPAVVQLAWRAQPSIPQAVSSLPWDPSPPRKTATSILTSSSETAAYSVAVSRSDWADSVGFGQSGRQPPRPVAAEAADLGQLSRPAAPQALSGAKPGLGRDGRSASANRRPLLSQLCGGALSSSDRCAPLRSAIR